MIGKINEILFFENNDEVMYDRVQYSPYGKCEVDKILDLNSCKVYEIGYITKTEIKNKKSARQKWV